ncbi:hypothetical protein GIB67_009968 [Kingdonia uniflora]|uniref:Uncharacterized protein n=1 Tax=Kingdonia uniflora TaxID=39325 RepID=A0A7J7L906_9MAGN|nr:hypothetical protein GIB67_009968 [Kingdonia uniflora]
MEFPRRRSTEETLSDRIRRGAFVYNLNTITNNDPDDFNDVFGGPPRSVMSRKVYGDSSSNLYEDVFKSSSSTSVAEKKKKKKNQNTRSLPVFSIPGMMTRGGGGGRLGFYDDIFGSDEDDQSWKSKSKSKSNSSSVLSVEDLIMSSSPPRRPPKLSAAIVVVLPTKTGCCKIDTHAFA